MPQSLRSHSDQQLYALVLERGTLARAAFNEIYQRHSMRVFTYCRRIIGDSDAAQDMFQETFVRFFESATPDREMTNLPGYLLRIARNLCLAERKKLNRQTVSFEEFRFPSHDASYDSAELIKLVETALESLKEDYREAYVLKEFLGLSYNEIAEMTGANLALVRVRIYRAKTQIREILAPYIEDLEK
ncbi:MAG TPA: RNA polymerase sigma factor [Patescibacteria group bacterium]|nr:RNA polymerase sigma factor [Patescibacteria group bacterium]